MISSLEKDKVRNRSRQRLCENSGIPAPKARNAKAWGGAPGRGSLILGSAESAKYVSVVRK